MRIQPDESTERKKNHLGSPARRASKERTALKDLPGELPKKGSSWKASLPEERFALEDPPEDLPKKKIKYVAKNLARPILDEAKAFQIKYVACAHV